MGRYINSLNGVAAPVKNKAAFLMDNGAKQAFAPKPSTLPSDKALICVVENFMFDAAGYCFDDREFEAFDVPDGRYKTWLVMDKEVVEKHAK
jgi:hypothetical protein